MLILLLNTGMRVGELLYLKWDNVDFDKKQIYIRGNVVEVKVRGKNKKSSYEIIEQDMPKTHSGRRSIPLNDNAIEALQRLKVIIANDYRVVATDSGAICSSRNIYRTLEGILEKCGIEMDDKVHALRHTFATMLFKRGVDVKTVSTILGHADVGVTYNTYIHVIDEQKQQAVDLLNDIF